ncbi:TCDD-inducible poly [ADP-ribose] polymerase [Blattella germanica]|nr:TCDD-inducible poly [ADP-ribose] polymerase [Blattella germanica]
MAASTSHRRLVQPPQSPLSSVVAANHYLRPREETVIEVPEGTTEFVTAENKLKRSTYGLSVQKIVKVNNPYLLGCYLLKKKEYQSRTGMQNVEMELFHATPQRNVKHSIITDNLDWRMASRCKFGQGVSFATSASYANMECSANRGSCRTSQRAMIIAKVLVGRSQEGNYGTTLPSDPYDTTTGRHSVIVKYYDNEFYPEYVVYYET